MYYLHAVNPHAGAEFHDLCIEGKRFGISETEAHPAVPLQFVCYFATRAEADEALNDNVGRLVDQTAKYPPSAIMAGA